MIKIMLKLMSNTCCFRQHSYCSLFKMPLCGGSDHYPQRALQRKYQQILVLTHAICTCALNSLLVIQVYLQMYFVIIFLSWCLITTSIECYFFCCNSVVVVHCILDGMPRRYLHFIEIFCHWLHTLSIFPQVFS